MNSMVRDEILQKIKQIQKKPIHKDKNQMQIEKPLPVPSQVTQKNMEELKREQVKAQRIERLKQIREQNKRVQLNNQKSHNITPSQPVREVKQAIKLEEEEQRNHSEDEAASETEQLSHESQKENKKPVNKIKDRWNRDCKILLISQPQLIRDQPLIKNKKYQIQFKYSCEGKIREATIRFGSVNGQDYTESHDESIKMKNYRKFGGLSNPLDGNYWRYWICNTEKDILTAYCQYLIQKF